MKNPQVNTILNGRKMEMFSLTARTRQGCPLLPLLFNISLEVLATGKLKKWKSFQIIKRRSKITFVHRWHELKSLHIHTPSK